MLARPVPDTPTRRANGAAQSRRRGRPADTAIERRVFAAALEVYAETGWSGFTIHAVATRAGVGKAAIYRRWPSKEDLIAKAMHTENTYRMIPPDTGNIRDDLTETALNELETYLSSDGIGLLRAQVEAKIYPELLGKAMELWRLHRLVCGREIVNRAIARGELPHDTDVTLLLDAVGGMIINRFIATPPDGIPTLKAKRRKVAERIADFALSPYRGEHEEV